MRRATLGIIALLLLIVGAAALFNGPGGSEAWGFAGVCIKSGLVLGALWLALPQLQAALTQLPRRLFGRFTGRGKNAEKTDTAAASEGQPTGRARRPRRRSNA
jgi:hypothetical protein